MINNTKKANTKKKDVSFGFKADKPVLPNVTKETIGDDEH